MQRAWQSLLLATALLGACRQAPPPQEPQVLEIRPASLVEVPQGGEARFAAGLRALGVGNEVLLTLEPDLGLALSPTSVPPGERTLTLTLRAGPNTPPGSHRVRLVARAGGKQAAGEVEVRVREAPGLAVSLPVGGRVELTPGGEAQAVLILQLRGGLAGRVSLASSLPWLQAVPGREEVRESGPLPVLLRASPQAPLGEHQAGLEVRLGGHRGEVSLPVRVLPSPPAPDFYLSLSPSGVALRPGEGWPGGREVAQVAVGRQGGFSLPVSLSAEASPPFAPLSPSLPEGGIGYRLQGEGDLWTLHLAVGPRVPPGAYTLTLRGSAGDRVRTASLTLTVGEAGFSLSLEPTGLTVQPGGSATATLTLTPQGGFTGTVALSLVGAPQGVSLSPTSVSVTGPGPVVQTLTLSVGGGVAPGTYPLKVRGTAGGLTREAELRLTVAASPPSTGPGFTLALSPAELSLEAGGEARTTLTLTPQGGFTGTVALSLVGAPQGVTLSPTSLQVTGSSPVTQALTLSASGSVQPGNYPLKVRGTAAGLTREAELRLTVASPAGPPPVRFQPALPLVFPWGYPLAVKVVPQPGFRGRVEVRPDPGESLREKPCNNRAPITPPEVRVGLHREALGQEPIVLTFTSDEPQTIWMALEACTTSRDGARRARETHRLLTAVAEGNGVRRTLGVEFPILFSPSTLYAAYSLMPAFDFNDEWIHVWAPRGQAVGLYAEIKVNPPGTDRPIRFHLEGAPPGVEVYVPESFRLFPFEPGYPSGGTHIGGNVALRVGPETPLGVHEFILLPDEDATGIFLIRLEVRPAEPRVPRLLLGQTLLYRTEGWDPTRELDPWTSIGLIGGKPALVVVEDLPPGPWSTPPVRGRVRMRNPAAGLTGPWRPLDFTCPNPIPAAPTLAVLEDVCRAVIPGEWLRIGGDGRQMRELDVEVEGAGRRWQATVQVTPEVHLQIRMVPLIWRGADPPPRTMVEDIAELVRQAVRMYFPFTDARIRFWEGPPVDLGMGTPYEVFRRFVEFRKSQVPHGSLEVFVGIPGPQNGLLLGGGHTAVLGPAAVLNASGAYVGAVAHELGHALGLGHPQNRCEPLGDPNISTPDGRSGTWGWNPEPPLRRRGLNHWIPPITTPSATEFMNATRCGRISPQRHTGWYDWPAFVTYYELYRKVVTYYLTP